MLKISRKNRIRFTKSQYPAKLFLFVALVLSASGLACQSSENAADSKNAASPTPEKKKDEFQDSFNSVQVAGFDFIFIFRRPDGEMMTKEDKIYLKENSSPFTNRWNLTDEGKTVIAGSNYKFTPENMEALKRRFSVEDRSPVKPETDNNNNNRADNKNGNRKAKQN
ncbi:MAG: hypothetical protein ACR2L1_11190 [Pyrinomonadaceae bacterium]